MADSTQKLQAILNAAVESGQNGLDPMVVQHA